MMIPIMLMCDLIFNLRVAITNLYVVHKCKKYLKILEEGS